MLWCIWVCRCLESFMAVLLMGFFGTLCACLIGWWNRALRGDDKHIEWLLTTDFKSNHKCFVPAYKIIVARYPVVGWTKHHLRIYLLHPFVYQWWWICYFCVTSYEYCLWNWERRLDHKVEHHHGIYCKRFGKMVFMFALFSIFIFVCVCFFSRTR